MVWVEMVEGGGERGGEVRWKKKEGQGDRIFVDSNNRV